MNPAHRVADPCPQCGKPDSARIGSSAWGHSYSCCSDECGIAFRDSPERRTREMLRIRGEIWHLKQELKQWENRK